MSGESIYCLLPPHKVIGAKAANDTNLASMKGRTNEKFSKKHLQEPSMPSYSTFYNSEKKDHDGTNVKFFKQREAIIGRSVNDNINPQNYLKKGEGINWKNDPIKEEKLYCKPALNQGQLANKNATSETSSHLLQDDNKTNGNTQQCLKNFIQENIIAADESVPKRVLKEEEEYATQHCEFAQIPKYLSRVKKEINTEKELLRKLQTKKEEIREQNYQNYVYMLNENEHVNLINKIKHTLTQKTKELQEIPLANQSYSAQKRKADLHNSITEIEKAFEKLNRDVLFVYKDDPVNIQWTKAAAMQEAQRFAVSTTI